MAADPLDSRRSASLGRLIARINMAISADLAALSDLDRTLSPAQKQALIQVEVAGSRVTDLANRLGISKQAASKLVQELEARGIVERRPDPTDRRSSLIVFTRAGLTIVEDTVAYFEKLEQALASVIGSERLCELKRSLSDVAGAIDPEGF